MFYNTLSLLIHVFVGFDVGFVLSDIIGVFTPLDKSSFFVGCAFCKGRAGETSSGFIVFYFHNIFGTVLFVVSVSVGV